MNIRFIGQGYNPAISTSLAQELMEQLNNKAYTEFRCLVAFASRSGVSRLTKHLKQARKAHLETVQIVVGIDQDSTSKEALEELIRWEVPCYVYHTTARNTFHPKVYLFRGAEKTLVIVGSNNLTKLGLVQNVESALAIEFDNAEAAGAELLSQIQTYFADIFSAEDANLRPLDHEYIAWLVVNYGLLTEKQQREKYKTKLPGGGIIGAPVAGDDTKKPFSAPKLQDVPAGFEPDEPETEEEIEVPEVAQAAAAAVASPVTPNSFLLVNARALVAEIPGTPWGGRWEQANFDETSFTDFFGGTVWGEDHFIHLAHVLPDLSIVEEPARKTITTASRNFRIELGAAKDKDYPTTTRPIAAFISSGEGDFIYHFSMPGDDTYAELRAYVEAFYEGPTNQMRRVSRRVAHLYEHCPTLPFWRMS
ncbi:phospholipase D-like domain-containing protein [Hymenobacter ruricola]|uniref:Phospholipase D family protein n=1 Tax=Hymenobacter ruricola TaxID=2791023 RepID=A0ABS0I6B9_9BACT|nr:phospholipase D family protein [Hymenobacter ruricola]MBF9222520.1 phospholipase D family protein [Hymenobacter ruricola]